MDAGGQFRADAGDGRQFCLTGRRHGGQAAQAFEQGLLASRTNPGNLVELRGELFLRSELTMESDTVAVRLIADAHEEQQHRGVGGQGQGVFAARPEQPFPCSCTVLGDGNQFRGRI
jgi:hypothetical protein